MSVLWIVLLLIAAVCGGLVFWSGRLRAQAQAAVPQAGEICEVPGGAIHYVDLGPRDAPVLVMIHGLGGYLQNLTYALADELVGEFRLIVLDRPGSGYSRRDGAEMAPLPEQAHMIWALLDGLGIEKPVLVGHSMGGAMIAQMVLDRPGGAAAMAMISPVTQMVSDPPDVFKPLAIRSPGLRAAIGNVLAAPLGKITADKVLGDVFAPESCPPDFLVKGGAILGLRPESYIITSEDLAMMEHEMPKLVARYGEGFTAPGAVLYGDSDALLDPDTHGPSMQQFGLGYEVLPGRGHMPIVTAPRETADFIRRVAAMAEPAQLRRETT